MMRAAVLAVALLGIGSDGLAGSAEVVAVHTLRPGTVIGPQHVSVPEDRPDLAEAVLGFELRRAVYRGHPVRSSDIGPVTLVRRNSVVTMQYRSGALSIRTEGRALDAGGDGERIRVMNLDTRQAVTAVVRAPGLVEVER